MAMRYSLPAGRQGFKKSVISLSLCVECAHGKKHKISSIPGVLDFVFYLWCCCN
jgi:hypothetical protein